MATSPTPSRRKPAAKANSRVIGRLLQLKAQSIDRRILKAVAGHRPLTAKEISEMDKQIQALTADADRVGRTRRELEQVPSLVQRGSVLL